MKNTFDRKVKEENLSINDLVLKWDAPHKDKGKHGKFDHMWVGPYIIMAHIGENSFILQYQDGSLLEGGLMHGRFLKDYLTYEEAVNTCTIAVYIFHFSVNNKVVP